MRLALLTLVTLVAGSAHADPTVFDRIRDDSGEVAGLPGWKLQRKADTKHCGGIKLVTIAGKKKLSADEQPLAKFYALSFPTNLNFSPDPKDTKAREASMKKFATAIETMKTVGAAATKHYEASVKDPALAPAAIARIVQIQMRFASVIARAEIPKDVRTGEFAAEKIAAFCDKMLEVAEPLVMQAEATVATCVEKTANAAAGWWSAVCVAPPPKSP
jgi:hypothetical protein